MQSFHRHFENKLTEYSDISNKKAYMEAMLVSFLDGEYQENNIRGEMLLNQFIRSIGKQMPESCMEEHTTEINTAEKSMITDTEPEKSESEYAEEITDMPEPEEVVKNLHEEHDVSETEIVPTSETFAEVIDIAETSTEEPDENSSVTENIQSETSAESITEIPTEEVDVISEIPIPIKAPAQKTETFTITDEMRKHFFKDLFGNDLSDEQIEIHRKEQINQRRNQEYIIFRNIA